jgi:crotonobetainyl-CoA:carnitine CoA-transferase CaiB-like acyl-CoA transferase
MAATPGNTLPPGGPLAGLRVLDLTINILGPVAGQILGDMGADVVKIEPPEGDPMRGSGAARHPGMAQLYFNTNRNKRSVVLDLKRPAAREALLRLADTADVFLHSLRPRAAARLGISYEDISARNPKIVYACAPGYRSDGPNRDRPAFDDVIQGESGIAGLIGRSTGEPRYVPMIMADKLCGHVLASSIGMALVYRERTGRGQWVEVPMLETMLAFNLTEHLWADAFDGRGGELGYARVLSEHRRPFATRDGHLCVLAVNDEQWRRLLGALDRPELADDPRFATIAERSRNIDTLYGIVAEEMKRRTSSEWRERLDAADVPNGAVNQLDDLVHDPYLQATGFFQRYEHPTEGPMVTSSIPVRFGQSPASLRLPPPTLGQHTQEVLSQAGYSDADIRTIGAR